MQVYPSHTFRRMLPALLGTAALLFSSGCGQTPRTLSTPTPQLPGNGGSPGGGSTVGGGSPQPGNGPLLLPSGALPVETREPQTHTVRASDLPAPGATPSVNNPPNVVSQPEGAKLSVPPGFAVYEWARDLQTPRVVTVAPNGDVFVAESGANRVTVLRDTDNDGKAEVRERFADGLRQPFGIAFYPPGPNPTHVYVANTDSVVRFPYKNGDAKASGSPETIVSDLPGGGYNQHWTRNVVFSPNGTKMYVSVGSKGNVAVEEEKRAAILEYNPDGTGYRVYASGLRNPVGLAFNPVTGALWSAVNERDGLGDDLVPDYATAVKPDGFYGWPWYYIGGNDQPDFPDRPELKDKTLVPDVLFTSHTAALGIDFYTGSQFPAAYKNSAFVALHGSWNRSARSGYEVVRIRMDAGGRPTGGYEDFLSGWKTADGKVWGRPVDVAVDSQGGLLITDDGAGKIFRVLYAGGSQAVKPAQKDAAK